MVSAQSDEIQVYDGGLAARGKFNLTLHTNFTPNGLKTPAFAGAVLPDKSLNGVPEWAYGVTAWLEAGLYLPLYSIGTRDAQRRAMLDGVKLRLLFAVPRADDRKFFYGVNFEFSYNARHWDPTRVTSEIRPIIGWHLSPVDIIVNPIFDTSYDGLNNLDFAPVLNFQTAAPNISTAIDNVYFDTKNKQENPIKQFANSATADCKFMIVSNTIWKTVFNEAPSAILLAASKNNV